MSITSNKEKNEEKKSIKNKKALLFDATITCRT